MAEDREPPYSGCRAMLHGLKKKLRCIPTHAGLILIIILVLFPVMFIFSSAFKHTFFPVEVFPSKPVLDNFVKLLTEEQFLRWMLNTLFLCGGTVALTLLLICPAAYAFSRLHFSGRKHILIFMIIAQMFPTLMGIVAIFYLLTVLGLMNYWGLMLIYAGGGVPFYVWFLKGYMDTIPRAVDEAALMDGASRFKIFYKIILPLSKPAIGVISFFAFIFPYNDFVLPSFVLFDPSEWTLSVGLFNFIGTRAADYPIFAAGVMMASIPILIVFLFAQRYLIAGLTRGITR
ncbi:MAG: sugar ABC transporter permease [Hadesarchaea archaeon]|nr:sugar ABC transporter permease [Hadesarchaea archaeon]